jgi:hypothetical protein
MRWLNSKNLRSTISAMLAVSTLPPSRRANREAQLDALRRKMLALAGLAASERSVALARRIRYAVTVETLWYARGELMAHLARAHGEVAAREKVEALGDLFEELLPRGLRSRSSPLDGSYRSSRPGAF